MKKIYFGIWLTLLFSSIGYADEAADIKVVTLAKGSSSWDGAQLQLYPNGKPEITILRITIPTGKTLPMHKHPVINAGVLLSGELTVITKDNKQLLLKAGDPIIEVVDTWHYGKNTGKVPAEILVFYAGSQGKPISVKKDWEH